MIETLKDFTQEKIIKDSRFYNQIISINYETINEYFMKNLLLLYNLIISKGDEEKIKCQIKMLGNFEEYKSQRLSSVSNNFENIDNEDRKLNAEKKIQKLHHQLRRKRIQIKKMRKKTKEIKKMMIKMILLSSLKLNFLTYQIIIQKKSILIAHWMNSLNSLKKNLKNSKRMKMTKIKILSLI